MGPFSAALRDLCTAPCPSDGNGMPVPDLPRTTVNPELFFKLEIDGNEVQVIGMNNGLSARDTLRTCITKRAS